MSSWTEVCSSWVKFLGPEAESGFPGSLRYKENTPELQLTVGRMSGWREWRSEIGFQAWIQDIRVVGVTRRTHQNYSSLLDEWAVDMSGVQRSVPDLDQTHCILDSRWKEIERFWIFDCCRWIVESLGRMELRCSTRWPAARTDIQHLQDFLYL